MTQPDKMPGAQPLPWAGLSGEDVRERVLAGMTNDAPDDSSRSLWQIVRANVLTLFNAIVAAGFLLLLALGQWRDALFGFAAVGNAVIGVVQEYRAKRLLDRIALLDAPLARVLRDAEVQEIDAAQIVRDDILVLRAGDQLAADALVLEDDGLEIDESLLTGEADPAAKIAGMEVLSGSIVVSGQGKARAIRVGSESFARRLTAEARRFSLINSEIRNGINKVLRWITWALLPVALIVVNGQMHAYGGWEHALASGSWTLGAVGAVGSIIAMVPLGLVLLTSVAFAVGSIRLAREQVLVQELAAVEGLARVDVICLDKTGTVTEGKIVFDTVHRLQGPPPPGWEEALAWFGADPNANATARCLAPPFPLRGPLHPASVAAFSSARKWSAVSFTPGQPASGTWFLGAPEMVLSRDGAAEAKALSEAEDLAAGGLRTLVLAYTERTLPVDDEKKVPQPGTLVPAVLLTFREKVRSDAAQTVSYFRRQGVTLKIISGDAPLTVAAVARQIGLDADGGYDARQLPADPRLIEEAMAKHTVFGRVTPEQKKDMVLALKRSGHTVAMTGDGVNDALALKEADIGIAMGTAASATKAVARLVLLDGRFDRLPSVLAEGRQVIANVERVSVLFLSKTTYAVALSVIFGALLWGFPFLPRQLSATDGITIGIPAFFLALMANPRRYRPGFLRRSLLFAAPAGLVVAIAVVSVNVYSMAAGHGPDAARAASVMTLTLVALGILTQVSRPVTGQRLLVIGVMYAAAALMYTVPALKDFFLLDWPPPPLLAASLIAALCAIPAVMLLGLIHDRYQPSVTSRGPCRRNRPASTNIASPAVTPSRETGTAPQPGETAAGKQGQ